VDIDGLEDWVRRYRVAWESNNPDQIGGLYADDAEYRMRPDLDPVQGRDRIIADWLERADEPGETEFDYEILAVTDEVGFVQCRTAYASGELYHNLWVVRLDDEGRATEFTEWWMLEQRPT
jgi:nuclear transport factor 2 (NTF2) superfamily protein